MDTHTSDVVMMAIGMGTIMIISVTVAATRAWQRVTAMKLDAKRTVTQDSSESLESLRREVASLRDTSTRYDMAFDTALQRIESRVAHLETRAIQADENHEIQTAGR